MQLGKQRKDLGAGLGRDGFERLRPGIKRFRFRPVRIDNLMAIEEEVEILDLVEIGYRHRPEASRCQPPIERVISDAAVQRVITHTAVDRVVALLAINQVVDVEILRTLHELIKFDSPL